MHTNTPLFLPHIWLLFDKSLHQLPTFGIFHNHDLDASLLQILLAPHKGLVFANDHACYLIQDTRSCAHVARRKGGVHGRTAVGRCW